MHTCHLHRISLLYCSPECGHIFSKDGIEGYFKAKQSKQQGERPHPNPCFADDALPTPAVAQSYYRYFSSFDTRASYYCCYSATAGRLVIPLTLPCPVIGCVAQVRFKLPFLMILVAAVLMLVTVYAAPPRYAIV